MTAKGDTSARAKRPGWRSHTRSRARVRPGRGILPERLRARWTSLVVAALLAFTWQSFVAQTHMHPVQGASQVGSGAAFVTALDTSGNNAPDLPANCPICQEIAHADFYLPPAPITLDVPDRTPDWQPASAPLVSALRQRSHAWRSRAPPTPFQA